MENKLKAVFCYEISKEAKMVVDGAGNHHEGYVKSDVRDKDDEIISISKEEYIEAASIYAVCLADVIKTDPEYLKPITILEYIEKQFGLDDEEYDDELLPEEIEERRMLLDEYNKNKKLYDEVIKEKREI